MKQLTSEWQHIRSDVVLFHTNLIIGANLKLGVFSYYAAQTQFLRGGFAPRIKPLPFKKKKTNLVYCNSWVLIGLQAMVYELIYHHHKYGTSRRWREQSGSSNIAILWVLLIKQYPTRAFWIWDSYSQQGVQRRVGFIFISYPTRARGIIVQYTIFDIRGTPFIYHGKWYHFIIPEEILRPLFKRFTWVIP